MATGSFTDLEVWKKSRELRNTIFELVKSFPKEEKYKIVDQIVRSSRSITANIAEGHGRFHYQENIQYCRMARGSLSETLDHLICAYDCDYIDKDDLSKYHERIKEIERILNGYIGFLKKKKTIK